MLFDSFFVSWFKIKRLAGPKEGFLLMFLSFFYIFLNIKKYIEGQLLLWLYNSNSVVKFHSKSLTF